MGRTNVLNDVPSGFVRHITERGQDADAANEPPSASKYRHRRVSSTDDGSGRPPRSGLPPAPRSKWCVHGAGLCLLFVLVWQLALFITTQGPVTIRHGTGTGGGGGQKNNRGAPVVYGGAASRDAADTGDDDTDDAAPLPDEGDDQALGADSSTGAGTDLDGQGRREQAKQITLSSWFAHPMWTSEVVEKKLNGEDKVENFDLAYHKLFRNQILTRAECMDPTRKFYVWKLWNYGLGSDLHTVGFGLGIALMNNRTLIFDEDHNKSWRWGSWTRYLAPITSCQQWIHPGVDANLTWPLFKSRIVHDNKAEVNMRFLGNWGKKLFARGKTAEQFRQLFAKRTGIVPEDTQYVFDWWHTICTKFMFRANTAELTDAVFRAQTEIFPNGAIPPHMIHAFVRRTDKVKDAPNTPTSVYIAAAERLRALSPRLQSILLTTDDAKAIPEFTAYTNWTIYYQEQDRKLTRTDQWNEQATAPSWINLMLAMHCQYFIGTPSSGWTKVIQDMRQISNKASNVFIEINPKYGWNHQF